MWGQEVNGAQRDGIWHEDEAHGEQVCVRASLRKPVEGKCRGCTARGAPVSERPPPAS